VVYGKRQKSIAEEHRRRASPKSIAEEHRRETRLLH
jgi:hypothetical protein